MVTGKQQQESTKANGARQVRSNPWNLSGVSLKGDHLEQNLGNTD